MAYGNVSQSTGLTSNKTAEERTKVDKKPMSQPAGNARSIKVSGKKGTAGI